MSIEIHIGDRETKKGIAFSGRFLGIFGIVVFED